MKKIIPLQINDMDDTQLAVLSGITGKLVFAQTLPFLGRTICHEGQRHCKINEMPCNEYFETALEQRCETAEVVRFYVGSKKHGPVLSVEVRDDEVEWRNCYAHKPGGWGKNCTCGGTWMGQYRAPYFPTWQEALENRYNPALMFNGEKGVEYVQFVEGAMFMRLLSDFLIDHA